MSVEAGDDLLPWSVTVSQDNINMWAGLLCDPTPIHTDREAVRRAGLGDRTINQGPANLAYMFNMLYANFPSADIRQLDTRMTSIVFCGDTIEVAGRVRTVERIEGRRLVVCDLTLKVDRGVTAVVAEARVALSD